MKILMGKKCLLSVNTSLITVHFRYLESMSEADEEPLCSLTSHCDILGFSVSSRIAGHSIMDLLRFLWFTTVSDVVSLDVLPASH